MSHQFVIFVLITFFWNFVASISPPTIDIKPILTCSQKSSFELEFNCSNDFYDNISEKILDALRDFGIFFASCDACNGFSTEYLESSRNLFNMPFTEKQSVALNDSDRFGRGYLGFGEEAGLSNFFEPKEGYSYGYAHNNYSQRNLLSAENIWPTLLSRSDIDNLNNLFSFKTLIAKSILNSVLYSYSKRISVGTTYLNKLQDIANEGETISIMRLFHYFSSNSLNHTSLNESTTLGSSPHTDWGLLTVISDNSISGLQFLYDNEWIDVTLPSSQSFVINAGDYLSLLTKQYIRSPIHRVVVPNQNEDRYSAVFFFYPNYDSPFNIWDDDDTSSSGDIDSIVDSCSGESIEVCGKDTSIRHEMNTEVKFNTLLGSDWSNKTFGDYIITKWMGVKK